MTIDVDEHLPLIEADEKGEDSGCGIPEEDLPRVKQRFFKG